MNTLPFVKSVQQSQLPVLTFDLDALAHNYDQLRMMAGDAEVGAVVKADAYGCGAALICNALLALGCETFFVANPVEGALLRPHCPDVTIYVFSGLCAETMPLYAANGLTPVLNSVAGIDLWRSAHASCLRLGLHIDTGMVRLGLSSEEVQELSRALDRLPATEHLMVMSHLACSDNPENPKNSEQLNLFSELSALLPFNSRSMANSDGVALGPEFRFDLVRPGYGLYGGSDALRAKADLRPVAHLHAPIMQVHEAAKNTSIGYGATYKVSRHSRIAIVGLGYADGYSRHLSNSGVGVVSGQEVPVAGRVSMDLTAFDVTGVDPAPQVGDWIELLGTNISADRVGQLGGTLGYEVLTSLGHRFVRRYVQDGDLIAGID